MKTFWISVVIGMSVALLFWAGPDHDTNAQIRSVRGAQDQVEQPYRLSVDDVVQNRRLDTLEKQAENSAAALYEVRDTLAWMKGGLAGFGAVLTILNLVLLSRTSAKPQR